METAEKCVPSTTTTESAEVGIIKDAAPLMGLMSCFAD
jgi:hypothetical protein